MDVSERGFEPTLAVATHIHQHKLPPRELLGEVALDKWDPVLASTENAVKDPACWLVRTKLLDARGSRHLVVCNVAVLAHQIEARGPIVPCGHCPSPCPPKRRVLHAPQPSLPQVFACCIPCNETCTSPPQYRPSHQEHFQGQRRRLCGEISASCPAHFSRMPIWNSWGSPTARSRCKAQIFDSLALERKASRIFSIFAFQEEELSFRFSAFEKDLNLALYPLLEHRCSHTGLHPWHCDFDVLSSDGASESSYRHRSYFDGRCIPRCHRACLLRC